MTIENDRKINYSIHGLNTRESSTSAEDRDVHNVHEPKNRHINIFFIYFMPLVSLHTP